jgi:hypothetical protein
VLSRGVWDHLAAAESGDFSRLGEFGAPLEANVRFEERDLFPACQALVGPEFLKRVALRAPKGEAAGYPKR